MKTTECVKCGKTLDVSESPHHRGHPLKEAVKLLAGDHAAKFGCDWPASHVDEVVKRMK